MITVCVAINGQPIFARSAVRTTTAPDGLNTYTLDTGDTLEHQYDAGAVALAIAMLQTIKEPGHGRG